MSRQRLLSVLWTIEIIVGLLPSVILIAISLVPYLVALPAVLTLFLSGHAGVVRSAFILNATMIGGILGITAILMAYRPAKLRQSPKLKRRVIAFGCAGVCADMLYLADAGLGSLSSHWFALWVVTGPVVVGAHCAYRVFARPHSSASSPAAS